MLRNELVLDVLDQLFDFLVLGVDVGALVNPGQKRALPILRFLDRITARAHRDEAGQVLIHRAQPVSDPRTHARARQSRFAAIHQQQRRLVIRHIRVHRTNHRDVVDVFRDVRKQFADFDAALAVFFEFERRLKGRAGAAFGRQIIHRQAVCRAAARGPVWDQSVHVRRPAVGENMDDALGFGRKMSCPGRQGRGAGDSIAGCLCAQSRMAQHICQAEHPQADPAPGQKIAG